MPTQLVPCDELQLTFDRYAHERPQWSILPLGWVYYHKYDVTGCWQIYRDRYNAVDVPEEAITQEAYHHRYPQVSPNGNWVVYERYDSDGEKDGRQKAPKSPPTLRSGQA